MLKGVQRKRADKYWEYTFKVSYAHPQKKLEELTASRFMTLKTKDRQADRYGNF